MFVCTRWGCLTGFLGGTNFSGRLQAIYARNKDQWFKECEVNFSACKGCGIQNELRAASLELADLDEHTRFIFCCCLRAGRFMAVVPFRWGIFVRFIRDAWATLNCNSRQCEHFTVWNVLLSSCAHWWKSRSSQRGN